MRNIKILAFFFLFFASRFSFAQVYVFARSDKSDIIQVFNQDAGGSKVVEQVAEREGKWFSLLETDVLGHGAIFCVAGADGLNPKYFYSFGKDTPAEAIIDARSKAHDYARGKPTMKAFIMRTFHNQNKFPLKRTGQ